MNSRTLSALALAASALVVKRSTIITIACRFRPAAPDNHDDLVEIGRSLIGRI
jgi:hypothetical protein